MLDYVKDDDLQRYPVDINKFILANRALFENSLPHDGVTLEISLSDHNTRWVMDGGRFQQALLNLVINAGDALKQRQKGRIQIRTSLSDDRHLVISVTDDGCGIPDDNKDKVLDLFFSTKGSRGTGLGLAMVQKFVEKSGGRLTFESEEGKGSVFTMAFPEVAVDDHTPPSQSRLR
jgi:signal transduction histidine kinase